MKTKYIDLMEKCFEAYTKERIENYITDVKTNGLKEHGFARLAANLGILIANGRKTEHTELFLDIMDFCCETMPTVKAANDFTVKEIIFCILALEEKGLFTEKIPYWKNCLTKVSPYKTYDVIAKTPDDVVHNWACFSMVSELMRGYIGLTDPSEFIDIQIATQLRLMDENGMYRDPNDPMVYDLVPRGLLAIALHFGYNGKFKDEISERLRRAGLLTLKMQSVTGEIPYGGRSNQFIHNEAHLSIVCEYEATRYAKMGDMKTAGKFKNMVKKALETVEYWLTLDPIRHIKNRYPTETCFGCEGYGYFDKYMITTASFLYAARLICDDTIPCTEEEPDDRFYTAETSEHFHKVFLRAGDYFAEIDTNADPHYECSGIGRIHKKGAHSTICLSLPGTETPNFTLSDRQHIDFAIAPGINTEEGFKFATKSENNYKVITRESDPEKGYSTCTLECTVDGTVLSTVCTLTDSGAEITVTGDGTVALMLPAFRFDGETETNISCDTNSLTVKYLNSTCRYITDGSIINTAITGENRNGVYRIFYARAEKKLTVKIAISN